ncbi:MULTISPECIES: ATP-binding protein [Streptomyces violaceusniger group]|uniref:ATP-binding protein n=2 Tax=Streptomyces violaceusniger group TaxID=2839105 RepID=A0ABD5JQZ7_9ACTN|nr:ATP-binding protein [Streptomyces violaceusniger]MEE4590103.1 ATP-binding protein [Streptomyces sp. DSM 41602]
MKTTVPEDTEKPDIKEWRWHCSEACAPLSRKILRKWLAGRDASGYEESASLLFMELFSNALRFCPPDRLVPTRWMLYPDRLRIEVDDASAEEPIVTITADEAESGRGLLLVTHLADKWGARHRVFNDGHGNYLHGKTVWFELYK